MTGLSGVAAQGAARGAPQLWFGPLDPILRPEVGYGGSPDFMQLFQPRAPWAAAAAQVGVFLLYPQFLRGATDAQLKTVFHWLARHHIALAVEIGLIRPQPDCRRTEGYDTDQSQMAARIKRLGGTLAYVVADEPVHWGRENLQPGACHLSIPTLANEAAASAGAFRAAFPQVRIIDGESVTKSSRPDWAPDIIRFLAAFRRAYGAPITAVQLDIAWWEGSWVRRTQALVTRLRQVGEPVGPIYDGNPNATSSAQWLAQARRHYRQYEALFGVPSEAVLQSWDRYPRHVLPETAPNAFTHLILYYRESHLLRRRVRE